MTGAAAADRSARLTGALAASLTGTEGGALLAVSGGPDSTALLHAAANSPRTTPLFVATVDHRLRPEAADEAARVASLAARFGLPHRVLVWERPDKATQATARRARYGLLAAHARAVGAGSVLTGHTADDQAETVLMRLIAGSGPAGLAGMARERVLEGEVRLVRPFLHLGKAELVAYCADHGLPFAVDPSNADPRYGRARLRTILPVLSHEGLTPERLGRLATRLERDAVALEAIADDLFATLARSRDGRRIMLDGVRLRFHPAALVLRVFDKALDAAAPLDTPAAFTRLERLERLVLDALLPALAEGRALRRTLRGVLVEVRSSGEVRLSPAPSRREGPGGRRAAGSSDLLGKGEGGAYIGPERVE